MSWSEFWYSFNRAIAEVIGILDGDEDDSQV